MEGGPKKRSLAEKFKTRAIQTVAGLGMAGLVAHTMTDSNLGRLPEGVVPKETIDSIYKKFDTETRAELLKIEKEYIELYRAENSFSNISDSLLSDHFESLVAKYGDGISISLSGKKTKDVYDHVDELFFTQTFKQKASRSHYDPISHRIYYNDAPVAYSHFDQDSVISNTPNLNNFIAEFSHCINKDHKIGRGIEYLEDLAKGRFDQEEMYKDPEASEFQAHAVTQVAIAAYLFIPPEQIGKLSFETIRNNFNDVYEKMLEYYGLFNEQGFKRCYGSYVSMFTHSYNRLSPELLDQKKLSFMNNLNIVRIAAEDKTILPDERNDFFSETADMVASSELTIEESHALCIIQQKLLAINKEMRRSHFDAVKIIASIDELGQYPRFLSMLEKLTLHQESKTKVDFFKEADQDQQRAFLKAAIAPLMALVGSVQNNLSLSKKEKVAAFYDIMYTIGNYEHSASILNNQTKTIEDADLDTSYYDLYYYTDALRMLQASPEYHRYDIERSLELIRTTFPHYQELKQSVSSAYSK